MPDGTADTLGVKNFVEITRPCTIFRDKCIFAFYAEI